MIAAWWAKIQAKAILWGSLIAGAIVALFTVYLRGQAVAKADAKVKAQVERATKAEAMVKEVVKTAETVAEVRQQVTVTPGSTSEQVAKSVREAVVNEPKSLQGRLGAMARDKDGAK
jgi:hypothetical protein